MPNRYCRTPMAMLESASEVVLILAPTGRDAVAAEQQLRAAGLDSAVCADMADLVSRLRAGAGVALVAEEAFALAYPPRLRGWLVAQPPWSDFPFLIPDEPAGFTSTPRLSARINAGFWQRFAARASALSGVNDQRRQSWSCARAAVNTRCAAIWLRESRLLSIWRNSYTTAPGSYWRPTNGYARRWQSESKPKPLCNKRKRWRRWVR